MAVPENLFEQTQGLKLNPGYYRADINSFQEVPQIGAAIVNSAQKLTLLLADGTQSRIDLNPPGGRDQIRLYDRDFTIGSLNKNTLVLISRFGSSISLVLSKLETSDIFYISKIQNALDDTINVNSLEADLEKQPAWLQTDSGKYADLAHRVHQRETEMALASWGPGQSPDKDNTVRRISGGRYKNYKELRAAYKGAMKTRKIAISLQKLRKEIQNLQAPPRKAPKKQDVAPEQTQKKKKKKSFWKKLFD